MDWSTRRQLGILLGAIAVIVGGAFLFWGRSLIVDSSSCFDGVQNGQEIGVDCGGACKLLCSSETQPALLRWVQSVPSVSDHYHLLAYIENPNRFAYIPEINYEFIVYGAGPGQEVIIPGRAQILPNQRSVIMQPRVALPFTPTETFFRFTEDWSWQQSADQSTSELVVDGVDFNPDSFVTNLKAVLRNPTFVDFSDISVVVLGYDNLGTVVMASQTVVSELPATDQSDLVYTWPEQAIKSEVERFEFVIMVE